MYYSIARAAACKATTETAEILEGLLTCLCTSRQGLSNCVVDSDQTVQICQLSLPILTWTERRSTDSSLCTTIRRLVPSRMWRRTASTLRHRSREFLCPLQRVFARRRRARAEWRLF